MPFEPGQSGNPRGRAIDKPWRDALRVASLRTVEETAAVIDDPKASMLAKAAASCALAAARADKDAYKEIGDRLDGKPKQQTELSGPDGDAIPIGIDVRVIASPSRDT